MAYQIDSVYIETKEIEIIETETKDFVSYPLSHLWDVYNILGLLDGMIISDHCPETYLYRCPRKSADQGGDLYLLYSNQYGQRKILKFTVLYNISIEMLGNTITYLDSSKSKDQVIPLYKLGNGLLVTNVISKPKSNIVFELNDGFHLDDLSVEWGRVTGHWGYGFKFNMSRVTNSDLLNLVYVRAFTLGVSVEFKQELLDSLKEYVEIIDEDAFDMTVSELLSVYNEVWIEYVQSEIDVNSISKSLKSYVIDRGDRQEAISKCFTSILTDAFIDSDLDILFDIELEFDEDGGFCDYVLFE